ncbi:MAG: DNA repair protein RecO, partial [Mailhella sp.]|nr:DNA repair protein RecO [Mailhella sp.]
FIDNGIVLRIGKFRETDLWVKLLMRNHGIVTAFAFGGSRSRRRFSGCLDSYNTIAARMASSKNGQFLNLQETTLLEQYQRLRRDFKRQGMAANCIRFVEALGVSPEDSEKIFLLTKSMLHLLNSVENAFAMLPILFRLRIVAEQGYLLDPKICPKCGKFLEKKSVFLVSEGYFTCLSCKPSGAMGLNASRETLDILSDIQEYSPEYWVLHAADSEIYRELGRIIDAHIRYHVGLEWNDGFFRRSFA